MPITTIISIQIIYIYLSLIISSFVFFLTMYILLWTARISSPLLLFFFHDILLKSIHVREFDLPLSYRILIMFACCLSIFIGQFSQYKRLTPVTGLNRLVVKK
jgi:hypothetical protein